LLELRSVQLYWISGQDNNMMLISVPLWSMSICHQNTVLWYQENCLHWHWHCSSNSSDSVFPSFSCCCKSFLFQYYP